MVSILTGMVAGLALYMVLSPRFNNALYRPLLFHPYPFEPGMDSPPTLEVAEVDEVFIPIRSTKKIHGWFFKLRHASKVILFSHGNAGNLSTRCAIITLLLESGASVLIYDYEGFGKSEGAPTPEGICENGLAAFDYLAEKGVAAKDIVVYGESLGAGVAMYLSTQRKCGGIILQSGFSSLRQIAVEIFPTLRAFPAWLFPKQQLNTLALAKLPHPPLLIIHGVYDEVIPYTHAEELYREAIEPKQLLTLHQSAHNDIYSTAPNEYVDTIKTFLKRCEDAWRVSSESQS